MIDSEETEASLHDRIGYEVTVPMKLMLNKTIPDAVKIFYGVVRNLMRKEGYCWATNEKLAELFEVNISTVKRWLKILSDLRYLKCESCNLGLKKKRKIWLHPEYLEFKKSLRRFKNEPIDRLTPSSQPCAYRSAHHSRETMSPSSLYMNEGSVEYIERTNVDSIVPSFVTQKDESLKKGSHKKEEVSYNKTPNSKESVPLMDFKDLDLDVIERGEISKVCHRKGITDISPYIQVIEEYEEKNGSVESIFKFLLKAIYSDWKPVKKTNMVERNRRVAKYIEGLAISQGKGNDFIVAEEAFLIAPPNAGNENESDKWTFKYKDRNFIDRVYERSCLLLKHINKNTLLFV